MIAMDLRISSELDDVGLPEAISLCLQTDPDIIAGRYCITFGGDIAGPLKSGILLTPPAGVSPAKLEQLEYRLATILLILFPSRTNPTNARSRHSDIFQVDLPDEINVKKQRQSLVRLLCFKGVSPETADKLVNAIREY